MGRVRHTLSALVAAPVAAGLLAGCGLGDGAGVTTPAQPAPRTVAGPALYADVTERMVQAGTARFTFSGNGGGEVTAGTGVLRFTGAETFTADVSLTMPATGRVRAVLEPGASYLALPRAKGLPKAKPWVKVDADPATHVGRTLLPVVDQLRGAFDPAQALGLLRAARRVEDLGPAAVEGEPTTHYRAEVDLRRATRLSVGPAREQYQSMLDAGATELDYEIWVDMTGLPRRYSADLPTARGLFSVTGVYRSWGARVRIMTPTPKQVFDADKLKG